MYYSLTNKRWFKKERGRQSPTTGKVVVCLCVCVHVCKLTCAYMCMDVYLCTHTCTHNSLVSAHNNTVRQILLLSFQKQRNGSSSWINGWSWHMNSACLTPVQCSLHYSIFLPLTCHFPKVFSESAFPILPTNRDNPNC